MVTSLLRGSGASDMDPVQESMVQWAENQLDARRIEYDRARKYYQGEHSVRLTNRLKAFLLQQGLQFSDNFCDVVIDAVAERLKVNGFISAGNEQLSQWSDEIWKANRMDGVQITTHTESVMLGDSYILVDWDEEENRPRMTTQMPEMIIPHYNENTGKMDWFSKKWTSNEVGEDPLTRLSLYYPDKIEKYRARGGVWVKHSDEGDTEWPVSWIDNSGDPIGITLIHFRNKLLSGSFGDSEITDIIPMQDLVNKSLVDLIMLLDNTAFGQRWTLNVPHGNTTLNIDPGSIAEFHSVEGRTADVGAWEPGNPEGLIKSIDMLVAHIAATSRTPQYMFLTGGEFPSGEALKVAESGLVKKVQRRQVGFGNSWEDVIRMAARVEEVFGSQAFTDAQVETIWEDPETRNEESHLNSLMSKMELGIPQHQLWREMGYSEDQIAQMDDDMIQERAQSSNVGAEILRQAELRNSEGAEI